MSSSRAKLMVALGKEQNIFKKKNLIEKNNSRVAPSPQSSAGFREPACTPPKKRRVAKILFAGDSPLKPSVTGQQDNRNLNSTAVPVQSSSVYLTHANVSKLTADKSTDNELRVQSWLATASFPQPSVPPPKFPSELEVTGQLQVSAVEDVSINTGVAVKSFEAPSLLRSCSSKELDSALAVASNNSDSTAAAASENLETKSVSVTPDQRGSEATEGTAKQCCARTELTLNDVKRSKATLNQNVVDVNSNIVRSPLKSAAHQENVVEELIEQDDQLGISTNEPNPSVIVISADNSFKESSLQDLSSIFDDNDANEIVLECGDINSEDLHLETLSTNIPFEGDTIDHVQEETDNDIDQVHVTPPAKNKKSTRKRSCTPAEWKHNKAKKALNTGEAHFSIKGQFRPGKEMRPACVCKGKCFLRINEDQRLAVHTMFWKTLADKRRQWEYIYNHSPTEVKKRSTTSAPSRRENSRKYYLGILSENLIEVERVQVCKLMFTNTLVIGDGVIVTAHDHCKKGASTPDKRGHNGCRPNKATEVQKNNIRAHINSFPRIPSHYVRAKCQREYVESGLSISKMAKDYTNWCDLNNISPQDRGSKHIYRNVLNTEFNIGFFVPKKDQCQLCNMFKTSTRQERESDLKDKWIAHIKSKKDAYEMQRKARTLLTKRTDVAMCTFDLQKVLPCPRSETSVFFYKNKLSVFNLTVYDVRNHLGKCYVWHEGIAKRGANEIGSCVFDHISTCSKSGITELHSFSDSCSGQNRNRFIYAMLLLAAAKFSIKIRHCFLEPGHTYNEGDSVHACIEKAAKRKEIFDLNEWVELIKTSKVTEPQYEVELMKRSDIMDFHNIVSKQNWEKDRDGKKITWNKVKIVEAGFHGEGIISVQYTYDGPKHFLNTNQKKGHPVNLKTYKPPCAYPEKIPLQQKTVQHLQELCKSKAIPSKYHTFYDQVIAGVEPVEEPLVDDPVVVNDSQDPEEVVDDDGTMLVEGGDKEVENHSDIADDQHDESLDFEEE